MRSGSKAERQYRVNGGAKNRVRRTARAALAAVLFASAFSAESADAPGRAVSAAGPLTVELVKPGLYRISGADGSSVLRLGTKGLVIVDSSRVGAYRPLMAEIERIAKTSELPARALVLTAAGTDSAGNVAQFVDAGVPVIVQQRALTRIAGDAPASGAAATRPFVTYDTDYMLRVGDAEVEIEHVGSGKTGADSVVLFRDLRVVAVGELFTAGTPQPDCASGGSFAGWAAAIDHLMWSDFDVVVPSRGAPVGKRELATLKAKLEALAARAASSPSGQSDCRPQR